MAKNSVDAYGAAGKTNLLFFDPENLVLVTDPASPLYDERVHLPEDEDMARNIDHQGVIEPISVSKNPETGETEVVFGRQRVKNARLANKWRRERGAPLIQVPGFVHKGNRRDALEAIISENEVRTADSPLGRAEKMRRLMALGRSEREVALVFGCQLTTVRNTLALLECTAAVQKAVESGAINMTHATQLAKLEPVEQRAKVAELVAAGEGVKPHERARKQRAVLGSPPQRMKTRKQILQELDAATGERADALRWVLGIEAAATLNLSRAA